MHLNDRINKLYDGFIGTEKDKLIDEVTHFLDPGNLSKICDLLEISPLEPRSKSHPNLYTITLDDNEYIFIEKLGYNKSGCNTDINFNHPELPKNINNISIRICSNYDAVDIKNLLMNNYNLDLMSLKIINKLIYKFTDELEKLFS